MSKDTLEVGDIRRSSNLYLVVYDGDHGNRFKSVWLHARRASPEICPYISMHEPSVSDKYICNVTDAFAEIVRLLNE